MKPAESEWLYLDPQDLDPLQKQEVRGVEINLLLSPYDVPEAVRGFYDKSVNRFAIEFRYIGNEPHIREHHAQHITLKIGKNSGRLYRIEIDVDAIKAASVQLSVGVATDMVTDAIERLASSRTKRHDNYDLAKQVIEDRENELFGNLVPA